MVKKDIFNLLVCPNCLSKLILESNEKIICTNNECKEFYNFTKNNLPVLFNSQSIFDFNSVESDLQYNQTGRKKSIISQNLKKIFQGVNSITKANLELIENSIKEKDQVKILIIGGGEIGSGLENFYAKYSPNIISFDVYNSREIDFIADAHSIPLTSNFFDIVIIQAVLEHVLEPQKVVNEIYRLLKLDGIVYSETPFLQYVHEGPYDFTRFTNSGHRYLFRDFLHINSGHTKGVGHAFLWSLSGLFIALFRNKLFGRIIRVTFFWLRFLDLIVSKKSNQNFACGVFFLGKKQDKKYNTLKIIDFYYNKNA